MSSPTLSLSELDDLIEFVGLPVRADTLEEAWTEATTPDRIAAPDAQFVLLVSMRVRPERESQFEEAILDFAELTNRLSGTATSTVHRSADDPLTWFLLERFRDQEALGRHMASEHLRRFQVVQQTFLEAPVEVFFLAGTRP
jgi:quinol monooxygenase YgiN